VDFFGGDATRTPWFGDVIRAQVVVCSAPGLGGVHPGVQPSGLPFCCSPEVIRLAGTRPTPSGGSLRQLLAPKVLASVWRKWQVSVAP
jgi:hypothetical protein